MCSKPKFIEDAQRSLDNEIRNVQSQAQNAVNQATGNTGGSSGGKGSGSSPIGPITLTPINFGIASNLNIPTPNLDQNFAEPVQPLIDAAVDVTTTVPVQAVEQITKIDPVDTATNVVTQAVKTPEQVIGDAEPAVSAIADATADTIITATKVPEKINQIDAGKVAEDVVNQAVITVTETPKMVVEIAENAVLKPASNLSMYLKEEAKNALELTWDNIISPFQPGTTEGTVAAEPAAADLDAKDFTGNDDPFGDIETSTTKADKMTEEERLRRIRRLMLNRYGREDTILTGAKDPLNRRRYASAL
jgi:hypothetical protein